MQSVAAAGWGRPGCSAALGGGVPGSKDSALGTAACGAQPHWLLSSGQPRPPTAALQQECAVADTRSRHPCLRCCSLCRCRWAVQHSSAGLLSMDGLVSVMRHASWLGAPPSGLFRGTHVGKCTVAAAFLSVSRREQPTHVACWTTSPGTSAALLGCISLAGSGAPLPRSTAPAHPFLKGRGVAYTLRSLAHQGAVRDP